MEAASGGHQQRTELHEDPRQSDPSVNESDRPFKARLTQSQSRPELSRLGFQSGLIPNLEELRRGLRVLLAPERVTELRAIAEAEPDYRRPHPASGYFNHLQALVEELARLEQAEGNCTLPNPVGPALLVRTANRIKPAKSRGDDD